MGSVTNSLSGLTYLTQAGGLLSNLPSTISASALKSASPEDVVSLSLAAIQAQEADGLFGVPPASESTVTVLPVTSPGSEAGSILPGVSSADLTNATPQENASINNQAALLQQAQALFGASAASSSNINLIG